MLSPRVEGTDEEPDEVVRRIDGGEAGAATGMVDLGGVALVRGFIDGDDPSSSSVSSAYASPYSDSELEEDATRWSRSSSSSSSSSPKRPKSMGTSSSSEV
jgi:hypothetical protein